MRFNIKEMKKQGIFMGALAAFLTVIIIISYVTSLTPATPVEEPEPEPQQNQSQQGTGGTTIEVPKPHSHTWSEGSTVKATCEEGGYTINTCSCGQSKTTNETKPLGHKLGEWVTEEPDEQGVIYKVRSCENCDYYEKEKVATVENPDNENPDGDEGNENPDTPNTPDNPDGEGGDEGNDSDEVEDDENQDPNPEENPEQGQENQ